MKHPVIIKSNQLILLERLYLKGSAVANYYDIGVQALIKARIVVPFNGNYMKDTNYLERLVVTRAGKQFLNQIFNHNTNQIKIKNNFKKQTSMMITFIIFLFYFAISYFLSHWLDLTNGDNSHNHFQLAKQGLKQELTNLRHFNSSDYNFYNIHKYLSKWGLSVLQSQWFPIVDIILGIIGLILIIAIMSFIFIQYHINNNNKLIASQLTKVCFYNNVQKTKGINWNNDLISIFEYQRPYFIGDTKYYLEMYLY